MDCIYIAASTYDARYTRICVASIRHFYPDVVIKLLPGGALEPGLREELARYWDVGVVDTRAGHWSWGYIKLEPLFNSSGERFLVLDSDTAFAGNALAAWGESTADFIVDDEQQSEADTYRLYYDWHKVAAIDPSARPPQFVFNSGQWFGTAGVLSRKDFGLWLDWGGMPPRLRHPELFMPGDQGIINYVLNQGAMVNRVTVERRKIMRWPAHGMDGLDCRTVAERRAAPLIVHWAGLKKPKLREMAGGDLLMFFEEQYYRRLPRPRLQRFRSVARHGWRELRTRLEIRGRMMRRSMPFFR